jgi:hypothetical protein
MSALASGQLVGDIDLTTPTGDFKINYKRPPATWCIPTAPAPTITSFMASPGYLTSPKAASLPRDVLAQRLYPAAQSRLHQSAHPGRPLDLPLDTTGSISQGNQAYFQQRNTRGNLLIFIKIVKIYLTTLS